MIPDCARFLTRPPTGTPRRAISPGEGLPILYFSMSLFRGVARLSFTARIERPLFHRGGSASKKGTWPLPSILLRPRVARAREHPSAALFYFFDQNPIMRRGGFEWFLQQQLMPVVF